MRWLICDFLSDTTSSVTLAVSTPVPTVKFQTTQTGTPTRRATKIDGEKKIAYPKLASSGFAYAALGVRTSRNCTAADPTSQCPTGA